MGFARINENEIRWNYRIKKQVESNNQEREILQKKITGLNTLNG